MVQPQPLMSPPEPLRFRRRCCRPPSRSRFSRKWGLGGRWRAMQMSAQWLEPNVDGDARKARVVPKACGPGGIGNMSVHATVAPSSSGMGPGAHPFRAMMDRFS